MAHRHGAMFVMDAVTSLGCVPVEIDKLGVDICYSCTQKGIGAPPGLVADHFQRARDGVGAKAQAKVPLVVPRREG